MWCDSVAACAAEKDVIITMVGFPKDVEELYFGRMASWQMPSPERWPST